MIALARRFVRDRRQGFEGDFVRLWERLERIVLDRRIVEAAADGDAAAAQERLVLDEIAELKARLRHIESMLAGVAADEAALAHSAVKAPVAPVSIDAHPLGADHYLAPASGFYPLEVDPAGRMYRWTGPTHEFLIDIIVDRANPTRLEMALLGGVQPNQCENLALLVDGVAVPLTIQRQGEIYSVFFTLPARRGRSVTTLMFVVPRVYRPADLGQGDDWRPLGVRFLRLVKMGP